MWNVLNGVLRTNKCDYGFFHHLLQRWCWHEVQLDGRKANKSLRLFTHPAISRCWLLIDELKVMMEGRMFSWKILRQKGEGSNEFCEKSSRVQVVCEVQTSVENLDLTDCYEKIKQGVVWRIARVEFKNKVLDRLHGRCPKKAFKR